MYHRGQRKVVDSRKLCVGWLWATGHECRKPNLDPWQEQQALWAAGPSLYLASSFSHFVLYVLASSHYVSENPPSLWHLGNSWSCFKVHLFSIILISKSQGTIWNALVHHLISWIIIFHCSPENAVFNCKPLQSYIPPIGTHLSMSIRKQTTTTFVFALCWIYTWIASVFTFILSSSSLSKAILLAPHY